jgi:hypothetical protein
LLRKLLIQSTLLGLVLLPAAVLHADVEYIYTGNDFTTINGTPGVTTSNHVSITLTFASALAPNLLDVNESGSLEAWSFSDGVHTISPPTGTLKYADFSTDASGSIFAWFLYADDGVLSISSEAGGLPPGAVPVDAIGYDQGKSAAEIDGTPGTWRADRVAPVPEPGYLGFASTAFAGLMLVWRHRKRRA